MNPASEEKTCRLVVTPGEPAGVGPDLCLLAARDFNRQKNHPPAEIVIIADPEMMQARARMLNLSCRFTVLESLPAPGNLSADTINIIPVTLNRPCVPGVLDSRNSRYVLEAIDRAVTYCQQGEAGALVTGPVHKGVINQAGIDFTGHTEYLEMKTGGRAVMMLQTEGLRVGLVTTHVPLARVSEMITQERVTRICRTIHQGLVNHFNIPEPHIMVCGLNPHAGEDGYLGREDIDIISPAVSRLQKSGLDISGPWSADTVFLEKNLRTCDAVITMYHDQGLPVLKYKGFGKAVNITFGLPIIRTSVDHGTATELAGSGQVDTGSLLAAIETAVVMISNNTMTRPAVVLSD